MSRHATVRRRRQWGADRHLNPMPVVPRIAGDGSLALGRAAAFITVAAWLGLVATVAARQIFGHGPARAGLLESLVFIVVVSLLAASATAYLIARLGFYQRARAHRRSPRAAIDDFFSRQTPSLTAIVPSYQEEPAVIRMTLLSAALQEYPDLRVVLLIDDPPHPRYAKPHRLLEAARELPEEIEKLLSEPRGRSEAALARYEASDRRPSAEAILVLAEQYEDASAWVKALSDGYEPADHNERFVADHVLGRLAADLGVTAAALRAAAGDDPEKLSASRIEQLYRRLVWTFRAEVTSFERKRYASLSSRTEQGDEPQQLHRPDGRALP